MAYLAEDIFGGVRPATAGEERLKLGSQHVGHSPWGRCQASRSMSVWAGLGWIGGHGFVPGEADTRGVYRAHGEDVHAYVRPQRGLVRRLILAGRDTRLFRISSIKFYTNSFSLASYRCPSSCCWLPRVAWHTWRRHVAHAALARFGTGHMKHHANGWNESRRRPR